MNVNFYYPYRSYNISSFSLQGRIMINAMKALGHTVNEYDIIQDFGRAKADIEFYFPWHYRDAYWSFDEKSVPMLLADNDAFNAEYIAKLTAYNYKKAIAPSQFVAKVFNIPRTEVIPYVLPPELVEAKPTLKPVKNTILLASTQLWHRRGLDISIRVLDRLWEEGYKFTAMLRTWDEPQIKKRDWLNFVPGLMTPTQHYGLIKSCDYLLHLPRGGAFELPILESLASGANVVIPERSPFNEIPLDKNYFGVSGGEIVSNGFKNKWHVGEMFEVDFENAVNAMRDAFDNPKTVNAKKYEDEYSPEKLVQRMLS